MQNDKEEEADMARLLLEASVPTSAEELDSYFSLYSILLRSPSLRSHEDGMALEVLKRSYRYYQSSPARGKAAKRMRKSVIAASVLLGEWACLRPPSATPSRSSSATSSLSSPATDDCTQPVVSINWAQHRGLPPYTNKPTEGANNPPLQYI